MKIGNGDKSERADRKDDKKEKRGDKKKKKSEGKKKFSALMNKKGTRAELRENEHARRLKRGDVQRRDREQNKRQLKRRQNPADRSKPETSERRSAAKKRDGDGLQSTGGDGDQPRADAAPDDGSAARLTAESGGSGEGVEAVTERVGGSGGVETPEKSRLSDPAIRQIAGEILDAVRVGQDQQKRQVMFLDVSLPGKGDVRIRLRRDGGGMEVRMRADNDSLARSLQEGVDDLREAGKQRGIEFTSVQVVR